MSSTASTSNLPPYFTRAELAKRWRVKTRTLKSWEAAGKIDRARPLVEGSKIVLFPGSMVARVEREGFPEADVAEPVGQLLGAGI